jgi:flagellar biogenesis protein FliO
LNRQRIVVAWVALTWVLVTWAMPAWSAGDAAPANAVQPNPVTVVAGGPASLDPAVPRTALGDQPLRSGTAGPKTPATDAAVATRAPSMDLTRVGAALAAVIVLIFILRWLGKAFFPSAASRGQTRVVEVLSRSALAPKQQVMLLRVGRRLIVVGDSGTQMNTLCEISDPDEVAGLVGQLREEKTAAAAAFTSLFGRFSRRYSGGDDEREEVGAMVELRDEPEEPAVLSAKGELDGLRERVRMLSEQFNR